MVLRDSHNCVAILGRLDPLFYTKGELCQTNIPYGNMKIVSSLQTELYILSQKLVVYMRSFWQICLHITFLVYNMTKLDNLVFYINYVATYQIYVELEMVQTVKGSVFHLFQQYHLALGKQDTSFC